MARISAVFMAALLTATVAVSTQGVGEAAAPFAVVVLPDTQHYSGQHPDLFRRQTAWIVDSREARNIRFVAHVGDVVNRNSSRTEYEVARAAMARLDGVVPYGVLPGNHDATQGSTSLFSEYFGPHRFTDDPWYCGAAFYRATTRVMGSCQLFSGGGQPFVVLHLGWLQGAENLETIRSLESESGDDRPGVAANKALLRWASSKLQEHAGRRAILVFHAFLTGSGARLRGYDRVFELLVAPHRNVFLVLNGHELGQQAEAVRVDRVGERPVVQMLANYQSRKNGGDGWLRILTFRPDERSLHVETYSATLDRFETDSNSHFEIQLDTGEIRGRGVDEAPERPDGRADRGCPDGPRSRAGC